MIPSRWYKIINDLWGNKTRTALIILSIAVGLIGVGTIISSRKILSTEMAKNFAAINPSSGTVQTLEPFDEDFTRSVQAMQGVKAVDARRVIYARVQTGPDEWKSITVFAIADYENMKVNKVLPQEGAWPPPDREILIERAALQVIRAEIGDTILIETPNEKKRKLHIAGTTHDLNQMPANVENMPFGYISFETLEWFGEPYGFNELHIVARNGDNKEFAQNVVNQVKNKAEKAGFTIPLTLTVEPGTLPMDEILQAILLVMGTLGLLSLFLSGFLIVNTITALLTQQRKQIGVMKAVGARTSQIMGMYLVMVVIYGLIALGISIPVSIAGSRELSRFMATLFNFDLTNLEIPREAILLQVLIGLLLPILASLYPFLANLGISAAEAIHADGFGKGRFGFGFIDRLISGGNLWFARRVLRRPVLLSLRNTFRSKGRLILTLVTLTLGGAAFMAVFSVRASLDRTVEDYLQLYNFEVIVSFTRPHRVQKIVQEANQVAEVVDTDFWIQVPARRVRPDGTEGKSIYMFAPQPDSALVRGPKILEGRWLSPEDENALVIDAVIQKDEPDIQVGSEIVLKIAGKERTFRVVGLSLGVLVPMAYGNYPYIAQVTGNVGRADAALVATTLAGQENIYKATTALENHFTNRGLRVSSIATVVEEREEADMVFGIIVTLLLIMAFLLALVGGFGLMGTMSINVLERTREIGVLRAIGTPTRGVAGVFIREGVAIGVLSWVLGALLAYPLGRLLSDGIGIPILGTPLSFSFSTTGVWIWLVLVVVLSAFASFLPARNAARLTVREVLAYE